MAGVVLECGSCKAQFRVGYPSRAVDYAAGFRQGDAEEVRRALVEEFFANNPSILRDVPSSCPKCRAAQLVAIHKYE